MVRYVFNFCEWVPAGPRSTLLDLYQGAVLMRLTSGRRGRWCAVLTPPHALATAVSYSSPLQSFQVIFNHSKLDLLRNVCVALQAS